MPWIKVDDHYDEHRKFMECGPLGHALWLSGMAYCNRNLTDGFIPWSAARTLLSWEFLEPPDDDGRRLRVAISVTSGMSGGDVDAEYVISLLTACGLWDEVSGGYVVHDYAEYQPTKEQVLAERAAKAAAGKAGGQASARARAKAPATARGQAKLNPVPVPVPDAFGSNEPHASDARSDAFDVVEVVEGLTGRPFGFTLGSRVFDTLAADVKDFGPDRVLTEYRAVKDGAPGPVDAAGVVFGGHKRLFPIPDGPRSKPVAVPKGMVQSIADIREALDAR